MIQFKTDNAQWAAYDEALEAYEHLVQVWADYDKALAAYKIAEKEYPAKLKAYQENELTRGTGNPEDRRILRIPCVEPEKPIPKCTRPKKPQRKDTSAPGERKPPSRRRIPNHLFTGITRPWVTGMYTSRSTAISRVVVM